MIRFGVVAAVLLASSGVANGEEAKPWRFNSATDSPDWFSLSGSYRLRYETLNHPFRAGATGSDEILVGQLLLDARLTLQNFYANVELEDARQWLADSGTALGTDSVNAVEPMQVLVGMRFDDVFSRGALLDVSAGRMTINLGGRRLVARNSYRNTINAFSGVQAVWKSAGGVQARTFFVEPVQRKPSDLPALLDNDIQLDSTSSDVTLWGLFGAAAELFDGVNGEAYVFGSRVRDSPSVPAADRDIYTPGFRLFKKPAAESWDFETEAAYQFGTSRLTSAATDTKNLQQRAGLFHGEIGYTLSGKIAPRFELSYDYASGDRDPNDNENNRFDTLYGARRFDFGPTGIYGPFARTNINTPGLRFEAKPLRQLSTMVGYRAVWLASARDQLTTARLQDPTGKSGSFVGHQIEGQLLYSPLPGNLVLELGAAWLAHGRFLNEAPNAPDEGNTTYIYASTMVTF